MANLIITPVSVDVDDNSSEFILNYRLEDFGDPKVSSVNLLLYYDDSKITISPDDIDIPEGTVSFAQGIPDGENAFDGDGDPSTTQSILITISQLNANSQATEFAKVPFQQKVDGAFDPQVGTKVNFQATTGNPSITVDQIPSVTIANLPVTNQSTNVAYRTIADAIAAASAGDTIQVASGTYAESFTIDKAITLIGPNQGTAATASTRANAEALINGKVTIAADNVTINGFQLDHANGPLAWEGTPDNFDLLNSYVTGYTAANAPRFGDANNYNGPAVVTGWNISGNYIGDMSGQGAGGALYLAGLNNSDISNNIFSNPQAAHLYLSSLTDVRIEDNTFNNGVNDNNLYYSGYWLEIKGTNDGVEIRGNSGQGNSGGIQLWGEESSNFKFDNITIEGNTFENFDNADPDGSGIAGNRSGTTPAIFASASLENGHSGSNLIIRNNNITKDLGTLLNNTPQSRDLPHLIDIRGAFNGVTIQDNTLEYTGAVTNSFPFATGLSLTGSLPGAVNISNNQFLGGDGATKPADYYAVDLQPVFVNANNTPDPAKYGTSFAGNLNITGNTISDWGIGVVLRDAQQITTPVNIAGNTFSNNSLLDVFDGIPPTITAGQTFTYQENQASGFAVGTVAASDNLNNTDNVGIREFDIDSGNDNGFFTIDNNGVITLTAAGIAGAANDFETQLNDFTLGITATDAGGLTSAVTNVTIRVTDDPTDTTVAPPTINTIAGDDRVNFSEADAGFNITGTGIPGATVSLVFDSGRVLAAAGNTVTVGSDGTWSVNVNIDDVDVFGEGTEVVTATQRLNGIDSASVTKQFTVDTFEPTVSITSNAPEIATGPITYTFTFSEAVTGFTADDIDDITVTNGTKGTFTPVSDTVYTLAVNPNPNFDGELTVAVAEAAAIDASGNPSLAPQPVVQGVDTLIPAAPTINSIAGDDRVNRAEANGFAITGTGEVGAQVTLSFSTGLANKTVTVGGDGNWSIPLTAADVTAFGPGSKSITATQTDVAGNISPEVTQGFTVDTVPPPTPVINQISGNDIVNANEAPLDFTITGTGEAGATVTLSFSSGIPNKTVTVGGDGNWSVPVNAADVTAFGEGTETITATQTDPAGNISLSTSRSITVDTVAPSAPVINIIAVDDIVNATEAAGFTIRGTGEAGARLTLSFSSGISNKTVDVPANNRWSIALTQQEIAALGQGQIQITATQTDTAGNTSPAATRNLTVATVPPPAPTIGNITPDDIVNAQEAAGFSITGTGQAGATVTLSFDSNRVLLGRNAATVGDDGNWSIDVVQEDVTVFGPGAEIITATQRDAAGNNSEAAQKQFIVRTQVEITEADSAQDIVELLQTTLAGTATVNAADMTEAQLASVVANIGQVQDSGITNLSFDNSNTLGTIDGLLSSTTVAGAVTINASGIGSDILSAIATNINKVSSITNLTLSNSENASTIGTLLGSNAVAVNSVSVDAQGMNQGQRQSLANAIGKVSNLTNLSLNISDTASVITTLLGSAAVASDSVAVNASGMNSAKLTAVANQVAKVSTLTNLTLTNGNTASAGVITNLLSAAADSSVAVETRNMGTGKLSAIEQNFTKVSSAVIGNGQTLTLAADTVNNATITGLGTLALTGLIESDTFFTNIGSGIINLTGATLGFTSLTLRNSSEYVLTLSQATDLIVNGTSARDLLTIDLSNVDFDDAQIFQAGSRTYGPFITLSGLQVNTAGGEDEVSFRFPVSDDPTSQKLLLRGQLQGGEVVQNGKLDLGPDFDTIRISGGEVWYTTADFFPSNYERVIINSGGNFTLAAFRQLLAAGFELSGDGVYVVRGGIGEAADPSDPFSEADPGGEINLTGIGENFEAGGVNFPTIQFVDLTQADIDSGLLILPTATDRQVVLTVGEGEGEVEVYRPNIILTDITVFTTQQLIEAVTGANAGDLTSITLGANNITLPQNLAIPNNLTTLNFANNTLQVATGATLTLTAAQAIGGAIAGEGTVLLTNPGDDLTADLSNINVSEVRLAVDAPLNVTAATLAQTLTFDVTGTGNLTLTAAQASDRSITNAAQVTITDLGSDEVDLGRITGAGTATASLAAASVTLAGDTNLGNVAVTLANQTLTLSAAQASGKNITGTGAVTVTGLAAATNLSGLIPGLNVTAVVTAATDISANTNLGTVDAFQVDAGTLTLSADQANDKTITGTGTGTVTVTGLSGDTDLSNLSAGLNVIATVTAATDISNNTALGTVDSFTVNAGQTLTLSAAQASGKSITGTGAVTVTGLTATTNLSGLGDGLTVTATVTADTDISNNTALGTVDSFTVNAGQTLTLSGTQTSGKSITGAGIVTVAGLAPSTNLSGVSADLTVRAIVKTVEDLTNFDISGLDALEVEANQTLTLTAAQTSGKSITGDGTLRIVGLANFPTPELNQIANTVTVILDGTAVSINTPGDTLLNPDESTGTSISGTAIGAEGQTVTVVFTDSNSNQVTSTATVANGVWTVTPNLSTLGEGLIDVTATAEDIAGNPLSADAPALLTLDFTPPVAPIINPVTGDNAVNAEEAAAGFTITGTGEEGATVTLTLGGTNIGTADVQEGGNWSLDIADGELTGQETRNLVAFQTDAAGNIGAEQSQQLLISTSAIAVTITSIGGADGIVSGAAGDNTVEGTAQPDNNVTILLGQQVLGVATANAQGNFTYTLTSANLTAIGQGAGKILIASQTDEAGNTGTSDPFTFGVNTIAPTVAITSIGGADSIVSGAAGDNTVEGTAQPDNNVTISFAGTQLGTATADAQGKFTYTLTEANLTAIGQGAGKTLTASQTDEAGNIGTSPDFTFAVDTIAPTVTITSSLAAGAIATGDPITYTFIFSEAVTNFTTGDITVTNGTEGAFNTVSGTEYTLAVTPQADFAGNLTVAIAAGAAQDTAGNPSPSAETVVPVDTIADETFKVTNFADNASGFVLTFNDDLNLGVLNLYRGLDPANPLAPVTDLPDLTLTDGDGNIINGSLIWNETAKTLTFVKTGDILAPGDYTLTLESRNDGFVSANGRLLDGDEDNVSGGNFVQTFTVNSTTDPVLTLADFSRGPGQGVDVPAGDDLIGLPIRISNPNGVNNISFTLQYDPDLLAITGANVAAAGWTGTPDLSTPGQAQFTLTGPALSNNTDLIFLTAEVPQTATYGNSGLLQIIPGAGLVGDSAVQLVANFGDTTGNQGYGASDAALIARVSVGLDTGFRAFPVTDPLILGDITGGGLSALDAARVAQRVVGLPVPAIPV